MTYRKTYRAGAIGHTGHGEYGHRLHIPFQYLPGVEMVAIADRDPGGLEAGLAESGASRGYADYVDMLAKENLDLVAVCPRQSFEHEQMIAAATRAGCHVYCDKPLAADLEEADRIVDVCDRAGIKLAVAHQSRFVEPFLTAKRMLEGGEIGELLSMHCRGKEDERGGGEDLVVLGVHLMDLMRWFAGDPQWVFGRATVEGREATLADAWHPVEQNGPVVGDSISSMFGFADGVTGYFVSAQNQHLRGERWGISLVGSKATISLRFFNDQRTPTRLRISSTMSVPEEGGPFEQLDIPFEAEVVGSPPIDTPHPPTRGNRLAVHDLIRSIEEDREPIVSGRDGRWALEMALGVFASHLAQRRLSFPLSDRRHPLSAK